MLDSYVQFQHDTKYQYLLKGKYGKVIGIRRLNNVPEIDLVLVEDGRKIQLGFKEQDCVQMLDIIPEVAFTKVKPYQEDIDDAWLVVYLFVMASITILITLIAALILGTQ